MTNARPPLLTPCAIILLATIWGGRELLGQVHAVPNGIRWSWE
jgi:hypothetical protein